MQVSNKLIQSNFNTLESLIQNVSKNGIQRSIKPFFQIENFVLYNDDSLEVMSRIEDDSVDMIFADPPYLLSNNGFTCHSGRMVKVNKGDWDKSKGFEEDLLFHETWIKESKRILKPEGTIWISGTNHNIYQCGFLLQKLNFHILNDITWYKPNAAPNLACTTFAHSHETLLWARKDKKAKHIFNYDLMKTSDFKEDRFKNEGKQMRSVWAINTPPKSEKIHGKHPTQKPLDLLKRIILASTNENALIFDPFNGGGTTGIASLIIGKRNYIGVDIESQYLDLTIKRVKDIQQKPTLF